MIASQPAAVLSSPTASLETPLQDVGTKRKPFDGVDDPSQDDPEPGHAPKKPKVLLSEGAKPATLPADCPAGVFYSGNVTPDGELLTSWCTARGYKEDRLPEWFVPKKTSLASALTFLPSATKTHPKSSVYVKDTSSNPYFCLVGGGSFPKFALDNPNTFVVNLSDGRDASFAAMVEKNMCPLIDRAFEVEEGTTAEKLVSTGVGGILNPGKLQKNGVDRWDSSLSGLRSSKFRLIDASTGETLDLTTFQPSQYVWTQAVFGVRSASVDPCKKTGADRFSFSKEFLTVLVEKKSGDMEKRLPRRLVAARELEPGMLLFGEPSPSQKTPGLMNIPVRTEGGEAVTVVFDSGGEFPPFAVQEPGTSMYSNSANPEYIIQFQVGDSTERKAIDDVGQYLEQSAVDNKENWITTGNMAQKLDPVVRSKVRGQLRSSAKYPDRHPLFKCKLRVEDEHTVCVDTNGTSFPVANLAGMRYKEIHVEMSSVYINSNYIDFTRRLRKVVVYPM